MSRMFENMKSERRNKFYLQFCAASRVHIFHKTKQQQLTALTAIHSQNKKLPSMWPESHVINEYIKASDWPKHRVTPSSLTFNATIQLF